MKLGKKNTIDDIICATDFLIENEFTKKSEITIIGEGAASFILGIIIIIVIIIFNVIKSIIVIISQYS